MLHELVLRYPDKRFATESAELPIVVDPVRARFSSWYEFFPGQRPRRRELTELLRMLRNAYLI